MSVEFESVNALPLIMLSAKRKHVLLGCSYLCLATYGALLSGQKHDKGWVGENFATS